MFLFLFVLFGKEIGFEVVLFIILVIIIKILFNGLIS